MSKVFYKYPKDLVYMDHTNFCSAILVLGPSQHYWRRWGCGVYPNKDPFFNFIFFFKCLSILQSIPCYKECDF